MARLPLRILRPDDFLSWRWFVSCLVVSLCFTLVVSRQNLRRPWRRLKAHLGAKRLRGELWMNLQYMVFKSVFDPLKTLFLAGAFLKLSVTLEAQTRLFLQARMDVSPHIYLGEWAGPVSGALFSVLLWDFAGYVVHYLNHFWAPGWELHRSHHRAEYLTPFTKWRIHPLNEIFYNLVTGLIVGLGLGAYNSFVVSVAEVPWVTALQISMVANYLMAHLRHTHFWLSYGWFNYVLQSPAMHQIHHSRNPVHFGKNLGVVFSIWDYAFGTLWLPQWKREPLRFGVLEERPAARSLFLHEMIEPFVGFYGLLVQPRRKSEPTPIASVPAPPSLPIGGRGADGWRQSGMSLVELMVAIPLSMLAAGAAMYLITSFFSFSRMVSSNLEGDMNLAQIINNLRMITRTGINVAYRNTDLSGLSSGAGGQGWVRSFSYDRFSDLSTATTPLMFFAHENAVSRLDTTPPLVGAPRATAVFFKAPTPTTSGEIRIALEKNNNTNATLGPNDAQLILGGVVGVSLYNANYENTNLMKSITMSIKMRSFLPSSKAVPQLWCPWNDNASAQCKNGQPFRDYESVVVLQFDNNRRNVLESAYEFPFGVYFFRPGGGFL